MIDYKWRYLTAESYEKKIKLWIFTMSLILIIHIVVNMVIGINGLNDIKSEHIIYHPDFENVDIVKLIFGGINNEQF